MLSLEIFEQLVWLAIVVIAGLCYLSVKLLNFILMFFDIDEDYEVRPAAAGTLVGIILIISNAPEGLIWFGAVGTALLVDILMIFVFSRIFGAIGEAVGEAVDEVFDATLLPALDKAEAKEINFLMNGEDASLRVKYLTRHSTKHYEITSGLAYSQICGIIKNALADSHELPVTTPPQLLNGEFPNSLIFRYSLPKIYVTLLVQDVQNQTVIYIWMHRGGEFRIVSTGSAADDAIFDKQGTQLWEALFQLTKRIVLSYDREALIEFKQNSNNPISVRQSESVIAKKRFCGSCGKEIPPNSKFCPACGQKI